MPDTRYRDWRSLKLVPSWLQNPWGLKYNRTYGTFSDLVVNAGEQAVGVRFLSDCPADALFPAGNDRDFDRYPADTDDSYRRRLVDTWNVWPFAGTHDGLLGQLNAFGFANVEIVDVHTAPSGYVGSWPPSPTTETKPSWWDAQFPLTPWPPTAGAQSAQWWSRFWVVLTEPFPKFLRWQPRYWGTPTIDPDHPDPGDPLHFIDHAIWGEVAVHGDGSAFTWGSTATIKQIESIRALIDKWKTPLSLCAQIWLNFSSAGVIVKLPGA